MFYWIVGGIIALIIIGSLIPYILLFLGLFTKKGRKIADAMLEETEEFDRQKEVDKMLEKDKINKMYQEQKEKDL